MKNPPHATLTLDPVRWVSSYFAFVVALLFASCSGEEQGIDTVTAAQTAIFKEMTVILVELPVTQDPEKATQRLTVLGEELKALKVQLASMLSKQPGSERVASPAVRQSFLEATSAFQVAQKELYLAGGLTPEINRALLAHHNPGPMPGEGNP